jgi:hypothetical protein
MELLADIANPGRKKTAVPPFGTASVVSQAFFIFIVR